MLGSIFHTFMIEQVLGLFFLVFALIIIARAPFYREMAHKMDPHSGTVFLSSLINLLLGIFLVVIHSIWVLDLRLVVTLVCWLILIRGVIWLAFPEKMVAIAKKGAASAGFYIVLFILAILGAYLLIRGFYLYGDQTLVINFQAKHF